MGKAKTAKTTTVTVRLDEDAYHYLAWRADHNNCYPRYELQDVLRALARADTNYLSATGRTFRPTPLSVESVVQAGARQAGRPPSTMKALPNWYGVFMYGKTYRAKLGSVNLGTFATAGEAAKAVDDVARETLGKQVVREEAEMATHGDDPAIRQQIAARRIEVNLPLHENEYEHRARQGCSCDPPSKPTVSRIRHLPHCPGAGKTGADLLWAKHNGGGGA